jgi:hypothetical protein
MLVLMLMRVRLPFGQLVEGQTLKEVRLSFRERLLLQRLNIYAIGVALLLGVWGGWLSTLLEILVIGLAFAILFIPARYVFTSEGIALNNALFRRWDEFAAYTHEGTRIHLMPSHGSRRFTLYVPAQAQNDVLKVLKRQVKSRR